MSNDENLTDAQSWIRYEMVFLGHSVNVLTIVRTAAHRTTGC